MTVRTAVELKALFETGDRPTQQDFVDLIDSFLHAVGDNFPNPLPAVSAANLTHLPIPDPLPPVSGEFLTNINRSDWVAISAVPTYATSTSFVVTGDYTGVSYFVVGRRLRMHLNPTGYHFTTVVSATYSSGPNTTTVVVADAIPTSALASVDVNLLVDSDIVITSLKPGAGAALSAYRKNADGTAVEPWAVPVGSATEPGLVELATDAETQALTDAVRGVTPAGLGATASVAATASRLMLRDAAGRAQVADPAAAADIATKSFVESLVPLGARSLAGTGYVTLPGGVIVQWGVTSAVPVPPGGGAHLYTLPVAYPTAHLFAIGAIWQADSAYEAVSAQPGGLTQVSLRNSGASARWVAWLSIGY